MLRTEVGTDPSPRIGSFGTLRGRSVTAVSSRTPSVPHLAVPGHQPLVGVPGSSGHHHLSASSLCVGQATVATRKPPNPSTQQPLAAWENGPDNKDPSFISAFEIKTSYASAMPGTSATVQERQKECWPQPPALSPDAEVCGPRERSTFREHFAARGLLHVESPGSPRVPGMGNGPPCEDRKTPSRSLPW